MTMRVKQVPNTRSAGARLRTVRRIRMFNEVLSPPSKPGTSSAVLWRISNGFGSAGWAAAADTRNQGRIAAATATPRPRRPRPRNPAE